MSKPVEPVELVATIATVACFKQEVEDRCRWNSRAIASHRRHFIPAPAEAIIGHRRADRRRREWQSVAQAVRLRILIVEDNQDSADSLKMLLEALGYDAHLVYDGEAAVRAAAALRPDVILMDIGLPGLNGYDAARQIRAQSAGTRVLIVALTGWGQEADRLRSAEAGIDHHLVKPLDLAVLEQILDSLQTPGAG